MTTNHQNYTAIHQAAQRLWGYMRLNQSLKPADVLNCLGCLDEYIPQYAATLYHQGYGQHIVACGGVTHIDPGWHGLTEAQYFANIIYQAGVPKAAVLLEDTSTNTGENIRFSYDLLKASGIKTTAIIVVHSPFIERRSWAAFQKQWPNRQASIQVTSQPFEYLDYIKAHRVLSEADCINGLVRNLKKVRDYPKLGYQDEQIIPDEVQQACDFLIAQGYEGLR